MEDLEGIIGCVLTAGSFAMLYYSVKKEALVKIEEQKMELLDELYGKYQSSNHIRILGSIYKRIRDEILPYLKNDKNYQKANAIMTELKKEIGI